MYTGILTIGSKGESVLWTQQRLALHGFTPISATGGSPFDGQYGSGTVKAVTAFQRAKGLQADGVVGPATYAELVKEPVQTATVQPTPSAPQTPVAIITPAPGYNEDIDAQPGGDSKALLLLGGAAALFFLMGDDKKRR